MAACLARVATDPRRPPRAGVNLGSATPFDVREHLGTQVAITKGSAPLVGGAKPDSFAAWTTKARLGS